jgi:hypothetical protein
MYLGRIAMAQMCDAKDPPLLVIRKHKTLKTTEVLPVVAIKA